MDDGLIVHGCRLLIPTIMRSQILSDLHDSHQGSVCTKQRARLTVYWPGIDNDIDNIILSCQLCQDHLPAHPKEPLIQKPKPLRPFQEIAVDYCTYGGQQFLIIVDCFTDWSEIIPMGQNTQTHRLITALRQTFCHTAAPDTLWSDGGPQFTANIFKIFATQWRFTHRISSPRYPQSNGKIEATVKSMKKILAASWDHRYINYAVPFFNIAIHLPAKTDSPQPRSCLVILFRIHSQHTADPLRQSGRRVSKRQNSKLLRHWNSQRPSTTHARSLPGIHIGSPVALQNHQTKLWDVYGTVVAIGPHRRYHVKTHSGRVLVCNRRFLRRRIPASLQPFVSTGQPSTSNQPIQHPSPPAVPSPPQPQEPAIHARHSLRSRRPTSRLIEDPHWP